MARVLAWLGGAVFVASLVYTFYFYLIVLRWPAAQTVTVPTAIAVNTLLFSIFAVHHSLFARAGPKQWVARAVGKDMERSFYVWVASLLLIAVCLLWQRADGVVYAARGPARWVLHAIQLVGVILTLRAARIIDPLELAGIRQVQRPAAQVEFRSVGPFGLVRHPIYLGWILMTFGVPVMTVDRLFFATISSLYLVVAIPWEEQSLVAAFGDRYRAYQAQVRWRLIPGIW